MSVAATTQTMRLVTYNLRYDSRPDNITIQQSLDSLQDPLQQPVFYGKKGEQPWSIRRIKVFQHLQSEGIVLAGFQEALVRQVDDLATLFGDEWGWVRPSRSMWNNRNVNVACDFVFGGSNGKWTADAYRVGSALTDDGVLASDHRPVFVDISLHA